MPLMPWQQHVADVALEVDPDTGLLAYREVDLTVPRQSGKTSLLLAVMVHRALGFGRRQNIVYTAQTRNDARKKWEDDHLPILDASPLRAMYEVRKTNGNEAIKWSNGSMHGITSSTEKAGHGATLDLAVIDEAFAHEDARLEQGLSPTMITRPQPQLWVPSTAGTARSAYLRQKVDTGRVRAELGLTDAVAYFEWSAPPDADPADPATWRGCMPALGHTISEAAIRAEHERLPLAEYRRAYLNMWPDDAPEEWQVIPKGPWEDRCDPESQPAGLFAFAVDMTPDRSYAAIGVAGYRADELLHVEVAEHQRGGGWVVERIREMRDRWRPCAVVVDGAGPAGSLIAPLEAAGIEVVKPSARDVMQACGQFYDAVCDSGELRHRGQAPLNAALAGAAKRPLGDGWAWNRRGLSVDISPLVAVTNAAWGLATHAHLARNSDPLENIW
ncbi:terminase large subunit domain-containing protein [Actinoallomurus sp. CA-142502]|uniref:terminase large subunit domain-containing protein n=1 Tax=Actinoallomurus sp. CA-142502 TaxID=3239885 RepID=UPI003D8D9DFE